MQVLVTHEIHAVNVGDNYYNPNGVIDYNAICNYKHAINNVLLVVRCVKSNTIEDTWLQIDGPGVKIHPIPESTSLLNFFLKFPKIVKEIKNAVQNCDRFQIRLPGPTGSLVGLVLLFTRRKYAVEFVGHAAEGYIQTRGLSFKTRLVSYVTEKVTRFIVKHAGSVGYRSQYLRNLYPTKSGEHEYIFSGAQIDKDTIGQPKSIECFRQNPIHLLYVGRLMAEKGLVSLLQGFAKALNMTDIPIVLDIVGDGGLKRELVEKVEELKITKNVVFHGRVTRGNELWSILDQAHLFILPSLTEGMPRSLIEAMSRGLPALGTKTGGIVELLSEEFLFTAGDSDEMAKLISKYIASPERLVNMSKQNYEASKKNWGENINKVKDAFWKDVLENCK